MTKSDEIFVIIFDAKKPLLASEIATLSGEKKPHGALYYLYNNGSIKRCDSQYGYKYFIDDDRRKLINEEIDKCNNFYKGVLVASIIEKSDINTQSNTSQTMRPAEKEMQINGVISKTLEIIQNSRHPITSMEISQYLGEKLNIVTARLSYLHRKKAVYRTEDIPYKYSVDKCMPFETIPPEIGSMSDKILKVINNTSKPLLAREVEDCVGERLPDIWNILFKLYTSGKLKRCKLGVGPYKYYSLDFDLQAYLGTTDGSIQDIQTVNVSIEMMVKAYQRVVSENKNLTSEKKKLDIDNNNLFLVSEKLVSKNEKLVSKNEELNKELTTALSKIGDLEEKLLTERERSTQFNEMLTRPVNLTARERSFL